MEKIFKVECPHPGGYGINLEDRIASLFCGETKVTELSEQHQEEQKWCECKEPEALTFRGAEHKEVCGQCDKEIKPISEKTLPSIPTYNKNSFPAVWDYIKKMKEIYEAV